jgi:long-chain fatty acid transport protein
VPRIGIEWHALGDGAAKGFVRAGYEIAKSPFEAQRGVTSYVDRDRHAVAFGVGATFEDPASVLPGTLSVDAHLQLTELVSATTLKANAADLVGDFTAGGRIVNFGLTMGMAFGARERQKENK